MIAPCLPCAICESHHAKTWVFGSFCDDHEPPIRIGYWEWRAANPYKLPNLYIHSDAYRALVAEMLTEQKMLAEP